MRRLGALLTLAVLTACTTMDDLAPISRTSETLIKSEVALAYPRFQDNDPHDWSGSTPFRYPVQSCGSLSWKRG